MAEPATALPLADRVAIVTGASGGIGRAVVLHLAALVARLILVYSSSSTRADHLAAGLNSPSQTRAATVQADVFDPVSVRSLFERAEQAFSSPPHIVVACAGVLDSKYPTLAFSFSNAGMLLPNYSAYAASNAAVEAMPRILAKELQGTGITANCVVPGPIKTDMFFAGKRVEFVGRVIQNSSWRIGETTDVAPVVGFLVRNRSTGQWPGDPSQRRLCVRVLLVRSYQ